METLTAPTPAVLSTLPTSAGHAEQIAVAEYRRGNPRSRAPRAIVTGKNTSASKSVRCVLTGCESPTWAAKWPMTKAAEQWIADHQAYLFGTWASCA